MKTAEEFLIENQEKIRAKLNGVGDYRKLYPKPIVLELMRQFSEHKNEVLTDETENLNLEMLLIEFCNDLKNHDVISKEYTQSDFERIAYIFLNEGDDPENIEY
jgi:hypothetical protein